MSGNSSQQQPVTSNRQTSTSSKRKGLTKYGNLMDFISLKEPSVYALENFARKQKQSTTTSTSSQILPIYVPKVNSKWDGMPTLVEEKPQSAGNPKRFSAMSAVSAWSMASSKEGRPRSSESSLGDSTNS